MAAMAAVTAGFIFAVTENLAPPTITAWVVSRLKWAESALTITNPWPGAALRNVLRVSVINLLAPWAEAEFPFRRRAPPIIGAANGVEITASCALESLHFGVATSRSLFLIAVGFPDRVINIGESDLIGPEQNR